MGTWELSNVRNSPEIAKAMMHRVDTDLSGTVNKDEWLAYFKKLYEKNEKSAGAVLKLYEKQIGENITIELQPETRVDPIIESTTDPIIESVTVPKRNRCGYRC